MNLLISLATSNAFYWKQFLGLNSDINRAVEFFKKELEVASAIAKMGFYCLAVLLQIYCILFHFRPFQKLTSKRQIELLNGIRLQKSPLSELVRAIDSIILLRLLEDLNGN